MAIIKCFECGKDVSDKASCCPHCGYDIAAHLYNTMPQLELDLNIGGVVDGAYLVVDVLGEEKQVNLICHTHGLSISDLELKDLQIIPFSHVIDLSVYYHNYIEDDFLQHQRSVSFLRLEYWNWKTKKRTILRFSAADRKSIYVKAEEAHKAFVNYYKDAVFKSSSTEAEKIAPAVFVREYIEEYKHKVEKAETGCCLFSVIFILLLLFPIFMGDNHDSVISGIWVVLFSLCLIVIFFLVLYTINCFFSKYS